MRFASKTFQYGALALILTFILVAPSVSAEKKPLVFLHYWTGGLSGGIREMGRAFNRTKPMYPVQIKEFEHEAFKVSIGPMLAGGRPPDMFSYWAGAKVNALVSGNYLASIDEAWATGNLDDAFPSAVSKACTYFGQKYALPLTQHYVTFFYNKRVFTEHGITAPRSWEQFIDVCDQLKQAGVTPIALGSKERWPAQFWFDYLLLRTAGPKYREKLMSGHASYMDSEIDRVFIIWKSLFDAGYFNESPNQLNWEEASRLVHSGKTAMTLMGTWAIGLFEGKLDWEQETGFDFFRFPIMDKNAPMVALGPIDVIVVARQGRPDDVNEVLTYFSDPGPQMEMSKGSGALSPSRAIPPSFYTKLQRRILDVINQTPYWAFNYDLATPPQVAEYGLNLFQEFIASPKNYKRQLSDMAIITENYFSHQQ